MSPSSANQGSQFIPFNLSAGWLRCAWLSFWAEHHRASLVSFAQQLPLDPHLHPRQHDPPCRACQLLLVPLQGSCLKPCWQSCQTLGQLWGQMPLQTQCLHGITSSSCAQHKQAYILHLPSCGSRAQCLISATCSLWCCACPLSQEYKIAHQP